MTDPTNTDARHPALVTAAGEPAPPAPTATGTDDQHPAIVTRPGGGARPAIVTRPGGSHRSMVKGA